MKSPDGNFRLWQPILGSETFFLSRFWSTPVSSATLPNLVPRRTVGGVGDHAGRVGSGLASDAPSRLVGFFGVPVTIGSI
jgi:hypothetical protein